MINQEAKDQARKELAKRELEKRYSNERENLIDFIKLHYKEETPKGVPEFLVDPYMWVISDKLEKVLKGEITRLIINIPPGHSKTEFVTKYFPVWSLGKDPYTQIIATGYSTQLTQGFSQEAKEIYESLPFKKVFPRSPKLSKTQNTKEHWANEKGGKYYATGTSGTITGKRTKIFIIDDPIKPDEAEKSEVKRRNINDWYKNTVVSRLFDPIKDSIIIIMQRTHEDDLCGHLISKMNEGVGEKFDILSLPAYAEEDEEIDTKYGTYKRCKGEPLSPSRFGHKQLESIKLSYEGNFECQYQQNPISDANREFHREYFRYYEDYPTGGRIFTTVDPAFSKNDNADDSAITTVKFVGDELYILEQVSGKFDPAELEDVIIQQVRKWRPEKVGVEAFQAQTTISFSLKNRLRKEKLNYTTVEEIKQKGDKLAKIRSLIPLYRNGLIYHNNDLSKLEDQLLKFPRGKHDDCPDSLQMALYLYELQPNTPNSYKMPNIQYNSYGMPIIK